MINLAIRCLTGKDIEKVATLITLGHCGATRTCCTICIYLKSPVSLCLPFITHSPTQTKILTQAYKHYFYL